jgi:hypothetical protein
VHESTKAIPLDPLEEAFPSISDYDAGYDQGLGNGIWIGAIVSPAIIAGILLLAWYLDQL